MIFKSAILNDLALADVKVLDLGDSIACNYCTRLLADYGADVIKIEVPGYGDPTRNVGPFPGDLPDSEMSGLFIHLNGNKRGVTLDITTSSGGRIFRDLVKRSDIVVEGFDPGYLATIGFSDETLREFNPGLVHTAITPFGQTGPYSGYKATDVGIFAMSGRMYVHGLPDEMPLSYGPNVVWYQVATTAAVATMGALFGSRLHGIGQMVDIAAIEALAGNVDNRPLFYEYTGLKTSRHRWPGGVPQGAYPCKDGYIVFGVGYDRYFQRLCEAMGRPDIYEDPRWANSQARSDNSEEFEAILIGWTMEFTKEDIFELCQAHRVMCAPLLSFEELFRNPQLVAREYFLENQYDNAGSFTETGAPFKMTESPWRFYRRAPLLGEHNAQVYCKELGYSGDDLASLRASGVI